MSNTNWTILNIPPTSDKNAVRRAYMAELPKNNPEDSPENFARLRTAYEQILNELDNPTEPQCEAPMDVFIARMEEVYNDFNRRCDIEEWKGLLKDELCMRLDLEDETGDAILVFLMNHYYLPHPVWVLLNNHFEWNDNIETLKQDFPTNFIDFIVSSIRYESIKYDLFVSDTSDLNLDAKQYDRWIWLFYEMEAVLHLPDDPAFIDMKQEIERVPIKHIYYDLQQARMRIFKDEAEIALSITKPIFEEMPDDHRAKYVHALALLATGDAPTALKFFKEMLENNPEDFAAKKGVIESLIEHEDCTLYEDARGMLLEILDEYPYNPFALHTFRLVTEKLIGVYEEKYANTHKDVDIVLTLAKHYLNGYQYDKCQALLEANEHDHARYYEYLADCYVNANDYKQALRLYERNIAMEKTYRNYVKFISALLDAEKYGQALLRVEEALYLQDTDKLSLAYIYDNKGLIFHRLQKYIQAIEAYDKALSLNAQSAHIYIHKARAFVQLSRLSEAITCCEKALQIFPYNEEAYLIQMEIFYSAKLFDKIISLADFADESEFESEQIKLYKKRALDKMTCMSYSND